MTIKNKKHMEFSNHNRTFSKPSYSGTNFEFLATESQFSENSQFDFDIFSNQVHHQFSQSNSNQSQIKFKPCSLCCRIRWEHFRSKRSDSSKEKSLRLRTSCCNSRLKPCETLSENRVKRRSNSSSFSLLLPETREERVVMVSRSIHNWSSDSIATSVWEMEWDERRGSLGLLHVYSRSDGCEVFMHGA